MKKNKASSCYFSYKVIHTYINGTVFFTKQNIKKKKNAADEKQNERNINIFDLLAIYFEWRMEIEWNDNKKKEREMIEL